MYDPDECARSNLHGCSNSLRNENMSEYTDDDIRRAFDWYSEHKDHVDRLMKGEKHLFPMSGSDISHPELWKAGAWKWFFELYSD